MVMLKTPKYAVPFFAIAVVFLLAVAAFSFAETQKEFARVAESGQGVQKEATKKGDKTTPKRKETHSHGTVETKNPNVEHQLRAPEMRESGRGKLEGVEKQGDKSTPKKAPTHESKPS